MTWRSIAAGLPLLTIWGNIPLVSAQGACPTIVVSGGGIPGEYKLYTEGKVDGKDAWASEDGIIYFFDRSRRRRLGAQDDAGGPGRDALDSILEMMDESLAARTTGAWFMEPGPYGSELNYPAYVESASCGGLVLFQARSLLSYSSPTLSAAVPRRPVRGQRIREAALL